MPVEIRSLIIKATITESNEADPPDTPSAKPEDREVEDKEIIIANCVDQIMEMLKQKIER